MSIAFTTSIAKRLWRMAPYGLRDFLLRGLGSFALEKRPRVTIRQAGPYYIIGSHRALSGLGRGARLHALDLRAQGFEVVCVDVSDEMLQTPFYSHTEVGAVSLAAVKGITTPGTVVLHLNPPQFQVALMQIGKSFLRSKYVQAYWAWELDDIPSIWRHGLAFVDEVCVPSSFVQRAIQRRTNKLVTVVVHNVLPPRQRKARFMENGILRCLFIFDMASCISRKNPFAVIKAFRRAFPDGGAQLTLKVGQPDANVSAFAELQAAANQSNQITILTNPLSEEELDSLYLSHDVYVSLHRSEGYGLTIHEAMLRGLHVVATGWSGNMDFMFGNNVYPVDYTLIDVERLPGMSQLQCRWAEPNIDAAADILLRIREKQRGDSMKFALLDTSPRRSDSFGLKG